MKCIPIHGLKFDCNLTLKYKKRNVLFEKDYKEKMYFITYENYVKEFKNLMINGEEIKECDTIAIFFSKAHNTLEIHELKVILSALYFSWRMWLLEQQEEEFVLNDLMVYEHLNIDLKELEEKRKKSRKKFNDNNFYRNGAYDFTLLKRNGIYHSWYLKLGNSPIHKDDFDRFLTRAFSKEIGDEYNKQYRFDPHIQEVIVDERFSRIAKRLINNTFSLTNDYSNKIKSALRLYFKLINLQDVDEAIITYATILETLLLNDQENGEQRIKVPTRCACIIGNKQAKEKKTFIYNIVYSFYGYRNKIIHEGKTFVELDNDYTIFTILNYMKNIIVLIIKYVIENEIKSIDSFKTIVEENLKQDGILSGTKYGIYDRAASLIYMESQEF